MKEQNINRLLKQIEGDIFEAGISKDLGIVVPKSKKIKSESKRMTLLHIHD